MGNRRITGTREILDYIQQQDGGYAIPPKSNTRQPLALWLDALQGAALGWAFFLKLKQFMRVATHYNKLASSFLSFIYLTVIAILLK